MAAEEVAPVYRWPHDPSWDMDGFHFRLAPIPTRQRTAVRQLNRLEFSPGVPPRRDQLPHHHGEVMANNVAVLFRAIVFCKDWWHTQQDAFWTAVSRYSLFDVPNAARAAAELFIEARKGYINAVGGCPNGAAQAVDAWVSFLGTPRPRTWTIMPPPSPAHYQEWQNMKRKRELLNLGRPLGQQIGRGANPPAAPPAVLPSPRGTRIVFGTPPPGNPRVKQEASPDEVTIVSANPVAGRERSSKRKRGLTESPVTPGAPSPKRRSDTRARVDKCEETLGEHIELIHANGIKISAQDELVSSHATKFDELESRIQSVEKKPTGRTKARKLEQSVAQLTERLDKRNTYIRTEIKKVWNDTRNIPSEQEQARLDSIRDDIAMQKVRIEDVQKALDEQAKLIKDKTKTEKLRRGELTARVSDLEEKWESNNGLSNPGPNSNNNNNDTPNSPDEAEPNELEDIPAPHPTIPALLARILALESALKAQQKAQTKQHAAHAATRRRLETLEEECAGGNKTTILWFDKHQDWLKIHGSWLGRHDREIEQLHAHARAMFAATAAGPREEVVVGPVVGGQMGAARGGSALSPAPGGALSPSPAPGGALAPAPAAVVREVGYEDVLQAQVGQGQDDLAQGWQGQSWQGQHDQAQHGRVPGGRFYCPPRG